MACKIWKGCQSKIISYIREIINFVPEVIDVPHSKLVIYATFGIHIAGTWAEEPACRAPDLAGDMELTLSADGQLFTGRWRPGSAGEWTTNWNGKRAR